MVAQMSGSTAGSDRGSFPPDSAGFRGQTTQTERAHHSNDGGGEGAVIGRGDGCSAEQDRERYNQQISSYQLSRVIEIHMCACDYNMTYYS